MPENPFDATMDQISSWKSPEIGKELGRVTFAEVEAAAKIVVRTRAAAAIDLMISQLLQPPKVDFITIRSAGTDQSGQQGLSLLMVLNDGTVAMSAVVQDNGACLLNEPEHTKLVRVTREQIDAHAAANALDILQM